MKRIAILIIAVVMTATAAKAQYYTVSDTLIGRSDHYYYNSQYDNCPWNQEGSIVSYHAEYWDRERNSKLGLVEHPDRRMAVKGIAALVTPFETYLEHHSNILFYTSTPGKRAEYVYLCTGDTSWLHVRDSARWDTLTPRLWRFPKSQDTLENASEADSFHYCYLFEAYFNEPLLVDSTFIMAGSFYSNSEYDIKSNWPTSYFLVTEDFDICNGRCSNDSISHLYWFADTAFVNQIRNTIYRYLDSVDSLDYYKDSVEFALDQIMRLQLLEPGLGHLGPFFAIVDYYQLDVAVNDPLKGWAWGSGRFPDRSLDTITARPKPGYCFLRWDDGNTDNPRIIELTQDTLFTALFDTCTAQDIAAPDPLQFSVAPNPASGTVIVRTPSDGSYQLTLYDMGGRCLIQTSFSGTTTNLDLGALVAGSYQLVLRSVDASGIKVIIKQ